MNDPTDEDKQEPSALQKSAPGDALAICSFWSLLIFLLGGVNPWLDILPTWAWATAPIALGVAALAAGTRRRALAALGIVISLAATILFVPLD